jgi:hypothetical protein
MAEPRYVLTREERSEMNRHMIKCYPSFQNRSDALEDFQSKLKFYRKLAEQQGKLIDCINDLNTIDQPKHIDTLSYQLKPLARRVIGQRSYSIPGLSRIDNTSYLKKFESQYNYFPNPIDKTIQIFDNLHESTVYINHYC